MIQLVTIVAETMQMLRARFLFWASGIITLLIALLFASLHFDGDSVSILFGVLDFDSLGAGMQQSENSVLYQQVFRDGLVPFWLGSGFIVLSLITTASVFPEMIRGGLLEVTLSKPISRSKLILAKYFSCLLYVASSVFVFCLVCGVAIYSRTGLVNLSVFWAVPIVSMAYACIAGVMLWIGVWTRSSLMALLASFLFWGLSWGMQVAEIGVRQNIEYLAVDSETEISEELMQLELAQRWLGGVNTVLPDVSGVISLLRNAIKVEGEQASPLRTQHAQIRSPWLALILTQLVTLGFACLRFSRRDYN